MSMTDLRLLRLMRRIHYGVGFLFLFFIWLFAVSGLLLNHDWHFADFWPLRQESTTVRAIRPAASGGDLPVARGLADQLGLAGEISGVGREPDGRLLRFQIERPGLIVKVEADLAEAHARLTTTRVNGWGVIRALHSFDGTSYEDPERRRNGTLTSVWAAAMIGCTVALLLMVLTSLYLWWRLAHRRAGGLVALILGGGVTAWFVLGLRFMS